ncbi:hypothetical protein, unlikely [Trypanosoma congolense IL3000]|uniref:Uncharacterized protein n=1 Tax=Trypanosoma congolense (strain IL3000) TaxID=1068625 RepID=F9W3W3_TRYCI|nr:hypothetical protein, unlikely [Trypanosoma congolense IL3000]
MHALHTINVWDGGVFHGSSASTILFRSSLRGSKSQRPPRPQRRCLKPTQRPHFPRDHPYHPYPKSLWPIKAIRFWCTMKTSTTTCRTLRKPAGRRKKTTPASVPNVQRLTPQALIMAVIPSPRRPRKRLSRTSLQPLMKMALL